MATDRSARMRLSGRRSAELGLLIATLLTGAASATDLRTTEPARSAAREAPGGWRFDVASYGWFSRFKGETATLPPQPAANVDLSFADILSRLDGAVMGVVYARRDRLVLYGDLMYARLSLEESFGTRISTSLQLSTSSLIASAGAGYTVMSDPRYELDLLAGARVYNIDTRATLSIPSVGFSKSGGTNETWLDPMIGTRFSARLSDRVYLTSWAFAGGFDLGSKVSWDLFAGLGYEIDDKYTMIVGYRGLGVDYERGDYKYDIVQQGPIAGLKVHF